DEGVELLERAGIEQLLDPLPCGELALLVLLGDGLLGAGVDRLLPELAEGGELLVVAYGGLLTHGRGDVGNRARPASRPSARGGGRSPPRSGSPARGRGSRRAAFPRRPSSTGAQC